MKRMTAALPIPRIQGWSLAQQLKCQRCFWLLISFSSGIKTCILPPVYHRPLFALRL